MYLYPRGFRQEPKNAVAVGRWSTVKLRWDRDICRGARIPARILARVSVA